MDTFASDTDRIAAELVKGGMDQESALKAALRLAQSRQQANGFILGGIPTQPPMSDIPPVEEPILGGDPPRLFKREPSVKERVMNLPKDVLGAGEALMSLGSAAALTPASMLYALRPGQKTQGSPFELAQRNMYIPRTESGISHLEGLGNLLEQIPQTGPLPELQGFAGITRGLGTQAAQKAREARTAIAPAIAEGAESLLEKQGLLMRAAPLSPKVEAPATQLGFYDPVYQTALNIQRKEGPGQAFLNELQRGENVNKEFLEQSGIAEKLRATPKITREEVQELAKGAVPEIQEIVKGENLPDLPKWNRPDLVLPQGTNYREVLLTLPSNKAETTNDIAKRLFNKKMRFLSEDEKNQVEQELRRLFETQPKEFTSSHWDEPNVLAHIRMNDRTDADGKKVLFVEELQSDWGQEGRDRGFYDPKVAARVKAEMEQAQRAHKEFLSSMKEKYGGEGLKYALQMTPEEKQKARDLANQSEKIRQSSNLDESAPPKAPFVTKTNEWVDLALKNIIKRAVDEGYDRVAFINGKQAADRSNLTNYINSVRVDRNFVLDREEGYQVPRYDVEVIDRSGKSVPLGLRNLDDLDVLDEYVGKDVAKQIKSQFEDPHDENNVVELSGLDLAIGGEGMKSFYNKIVPKQVESLLKKYGGGKLGEVKIDFGGKGPSRYSNYETYVEAQRGPASQPGFDITPEMRSRFQKPIPYKEGGSVSREQMQAAAREIAKKYAKGGAVKMRGGGLSKTAQAGVKAAKTAAAEASKMRAQAGKKVGDIIAEIEPEKFSEALGKQNIEGSGIVKVTQADRTRVGGPSNNIGGSMFSALQLYDPFYEQAGATWGVGKKSTAQALINQSTPETLWTTLLGSEDQLKSNPIVFDQLFKAFTRGVKEGRLTPELRNKINTKLEPLFGEGTDILDPKIRQMADTFEKRALLADLLLGKQIGGELRGGSIIPGTEILKRETEPLLLHPAHGGDVPTFSVGPRLFQLSGEVMNRPDLHPGFPVILGGKDLGVTYKPVPGDIAMRDFVQRMKKERGRVPGYYEWTMGEKGRGLPSQLVTDEYLTYLQKEGFKSGGLAKTATTAAKAAKKAKSAKYVDPKTEHLEDWRWRPMEDVEKELQLVEVPDYIQQGYGEFMKEQLERAKAGEISPRDLIKAYTITQSSIGRGGLPYTTATKTGMKLPRTETEVRPEGAFAEWLGSRMGQKYLDAAERGELSTEAIEELRQLFAPFGKQNEQAEAMKYAANVIPPMRERISGAIRGSPDEYRDFAESLRGIATAKSGFVGSMLGRGDLPTFDARQVNLHTAGMPSPTASPLSVLKRGKGQAGREAVDRLAARQQLLELGLDPNLEPFYQHLAHHAVWDKLGGSKTTHEDIVRAMRGYSQGGLSKTAKKAKDK